MPTRLLIVVVTLNLVFGQLVLKYAISTLGGRAALASLTSLPKFVLAAIASPWMWATVMIQGLGFFLWMSLVSREKLGVASASVGAGFYILMPLCAWALFGESLTNWQWLGISLITIGVIFVSLNTA
jgi:drug/metabolite transporter (DMT)-like permease